MKTLHKLLIVFVLSICIAIPFLTTSAFAFTNAPNTTITEWEMKWEENNPTDGIRATSSIQQEEGWFKVNYNEPMLEKPEFIQVAWVKFRLPKLNWTRPTLLISKLNAKDVTIYIDNRIVYETSRNYSKDSNKVLLPLNSTDSNKIVYMKLDTVEKKIGLKSQPIIGEYQTINIGYLKRDMLDVILGASLIFVSLAVLSSMPFLNKTYLVGWNSLCLIMLSIGIMIIANSPFVHTTFSDFGLVSYYIFDVASNILMPSIFLFFEKIFGKGPYGLITRFRKFQVFLVFVSSVLLFGSIAFDSIRNIYLLVGIFYFGLSIIIGNILLIVCLILFCRQGNKDAIILTTGFGAFAAIGAIEVIWFFIQNRGYDLFFWKWGVICFIVALMIILSRRILHNYEQLVKYSKQLEIFNNELQRSEKMEIISQLAASVAHEVRNPLQVTRGFLQLLGEKSKDNKDKSYMALAIDELDRASEIITDFLAFAKPQIEQTTLLNIADELKQIEGILLPLATMQGGIIKVELSTNLYVRGNSSKLKQALINIIKNSIEAFGNDDGVILIQAYEDKELKEIVIRIKDNGEGMSEADLKRLGEPYYSKKTKGTGLGLMVTYRIIEMMKGKVVFISSKGVGTEAILRFPSIIK